VLFALILMLILRFLQIFFLNIYYQEMKIDETRRIAASIADKYGQDDLFSQIVAITQKNDLYVQIEARNGTILFSPYSFGGSQSSSIFPDINPSAVLHREMSQLKAKLLRDNVNNVSAIINNSSSNTNILAYCAYLNETEENEVYLYIFSPLYPVESTVDILASQLSYVTVISLLLAFLLSFYISKMVTRPLVRITNSAAQLAEGHYGVEFEGGRYSEITKLADTLTYTSAKLAKADNMQKDLLANISHDLRTPLTMVKSYAEMIRDLSGGDPEKRVAHLQVIIDEADRLNVLVSDILALSKIQSGRDSLSLSTFSLKNTVENILSSYGILSERDGYSLVFHANGDGRVLGDENKIKQVLSNLINNAVQFSGEDKIIEIDMAESDAHVRCSVTDHGPGIPQNELAGIWERYFRASGNRQRNAQGAGLGLSIVREILTLHDAKFGVSSELGRGSTFWFELNR
jgi:signal transduction histidine kinase